MARVALGSGKSVGAGGGGKLWGREEGTWGRMGTARVDVCMYFSVRVPPSFSLSSEGFFVPLKALLAPLNNAF